jgi:hypothetical protein
MLSDQTYIDNYVDPARRLNIHQARNLGNREKCWYCGAEGPTTGDHFYPKSLGGRLKVRACTSCNNAKADLTPLEWMKYLRQTRNRWSRIKSKFLQEQADAEIAKINRMLRATFTLWIRVKHSVKSSYCSVGTIVSKQKKLNKRQNMKIVYICHPIAGNVANNIKKILKIIRYINLTMPDVVPFAPYLGDVLALEEDKPGERTRGIRNCIAILKSGIMNEIWIYGKRISGGMKTEIDMAIERDIPIIRMDADTEVPEELSIYMNKGY